MSKHNVVIHEQITMRARHYLERMEWKRKLCRLQLLQEQLELENQCVPRYPLLEPIHGHRKREGPTWSSALFCCVAGTVILFTVSSWSYPLP